MARFNFTNITGQSRVDIADIMGNFNIIESDAATSSDLTTAVNTLNNTITTKETDLKAVATTSANGMMSSTDKAKLDGIANNANNYTLPEASSTLGGVKTTSIVADASEYTPTPIIGGVPYYKDTNTTYTPATTTTNGLMSSTDKSKLDGIAQGATANVVENVLTSTSTTNALSAAQGKFLKDTVDGKQKTILVGIDAPTGGSDGDIYIQYFE